MQDVREAALRYLQCSADQNINLISALRSGLAEVAAMEEQGCLLCTAGKIWQIAAENTETALRFLEQVPENATMLEVQQVSQIEAVAERFQPHCIAIYHNAWYARGQISLPEGGAVLRAVDVETAGLLARHYHLPGAPDGTLEGSAAYLRARAARGALLGAYLDGRLAGFVGSHEEGSIGMLTVLPEYRRRGLGALLECAAIAEALKEGRIPFGQVAPDNTASLALQRAVGMTIAGEPVCWMDKAE